MQLVVQPFGSEKLGDVLRQALAGERGQFTTFRAAVAFLKRSGIKHIEKELRDFIDEGTQVEIVVGVDRQGTSLEGLELLIEVLSDKGQAWVNHVSEMFVTFHPKLYLFEGETQALLVVGSGNLTEGGLYTNDEAAALYALNLDHIDDIALLSSANSYLDQWCDESSGNVRRLDEDLLEKLVLAGLVLSEQRSSSDDEAEQQLIRDDTVQYDVEPEGEPLFARSVFRRAAPRIARVLSPEPSTMFDDHEDSSSLSEQPAVPGYQYTAPEQIQSTGFVMTLQRTDVGVGQTTRGTARRSPELFIPLAARNARPEFWGWDDQFVEDIDRQGKLDRTNVKMRLGSEVIYVNMMTWPVKHDFRLRSEALRSAGDVGDILRIEKVNETAGYSYYVEIVPYGTSTYQYFLELCDNDVRNSQKKWGYYYY